MKKWECTICGYIHEGDEPPESCPLCGAGPEYFKEVVEDAKRSVPLPSSAKNGAAETDSAALQQESSDAAPSGLTALILKFHLHPITVHTPNGVLPLALIFLFIAILFGIAGFEKAAFYNLIFVLLTMPVVLLTGYTEWQNRYKGLRSKIFITKIIASIVVTIILTIMVIWRFADPQIAESANRWVYLLLGIVMVGAVGLAGHLGGTLVHESRN
ncbi:MAG: DUF2231 domain-containing protein [Desulfobacterales bacterium]|nr:DUF2231 domain-containing protein [Desulfobacterales bacterium]